MKHKISVFVMLFFILGCSSKNSDISNQTALFWHKAIYKDITNYNLDNADDKFTSLEIEHPNSKFIPIDLLNLFVAHYELKEYELASFYLDEYKKRYANRSEKEWCDYTQVKLKFFSLNNAYTNQKKLLEAITFVNKIINLYPNSIYNYELMTIKEKLENTRVVFNNKIAQLYKKLDKPKAVDIYKEEADTKIIPPSIPWYKKIFYW